jgi:hypothetical protein
MKNRYLIFLVFLIVTGCAESASNSDNATMTTGTLSGQIGGLFDSLGHEIKDRSGVEVKVEGFDISGLTSKDGYWQLSNLPAMRTYNFSYSKEGYLPIRQMGFLFYGATASNEFHAELIQEPKFEFTIDAIIQPSKNVLPTIYSHFIANVDFLLNVGVLLISGHSSNLDADNVKSYESIESTMTTIAYVKSDSAKSLTFQIDPPPSYLSGDTVYFRLYPYSHLTTYFDSEAGDDHYVGFAKGSNVLSLIIP